MMAGTVESIRRPVFEGRARRAALAVLALNLWLLSLGTAAGADSVAPGRTGSVARPELTAAIALGAVALSTLGLILWLVVLRSTKPLVLRSARVRQFRSELRHLDAVVLSWLPSTVHDEPPRDRGPQPLRRNDDGST